MARKPRLKVFGRSEDGTLTVEAMIVLPMLLWALGAMFIYWDAFKAQNINLKATYTLADLISRESNPIDPAYIDGMNGVYNFLIKSDFGNEIRVTVVDFTQEEEDDPIEMNLVWSHATGGLGDHDDIADIEDLLPILNPGDSLIMVETWMTWMPPIGMDIFAPTLEQMNFSNMVFTSPRFVPQVVFDDT